MENLKQSLRNAIKEALDMKIESEKNFLSKRKSVAEFDKAFELSVKSIKSDFCIALKVNTDDSSRIIRIKDPENPTDTEIDYILNAYSDKYKEHIIGFRNETYNYYGQHMPASYSETYPIFEAPYEEDFYKEMDEYISRKAEWCAKYGCD